MYASQIDGISQSPNNHIVLLTQVIKFSSEDIQWDQNLIEI